MHLKNKHQIPTGLNNDRELDFFHEVDDELNVTQRQRGKWVGISLGFTNTLFRNFVKKGYIRLHQGGLRRFGKSVYTLDTNGYNQIIVASMGDPEAVATNLGLRGKSANKLVVSSRARQCRGLPNA